MPKNDLNVTLKGIDELLFSTEEQRQEEKREQVQQIPIDELHPFTNHPFKVVDDDAMTRTVESIAQFGVLAPLIARPRPDGDGYEIISGHNHYVRDGFGKLRISKIKYSDIKKFYYSLILEKGFKPNSMEIVHTLLHPTFTMAVRDGLLRLNPTEGVMAEIKKSHCWEKTKRHALTVAEQRAFTNYIANSEEYRGWFPLFTVMLGTGCRIGEVLGLRWQDVDFKNRTISINHNLVYRVQEDGTCTNHVNSPKTKAGIRIIPMLDEVFDAFLEEYQYPSISSVSAPMKLMDTPALFSALAMERFISPMPSTALSARFVQTIIRKKNPRRRKKIVTRFFCQSLAAISCGTRSALASARMKPT